MRAFRHGMTLLEVLFAIGVVAIGVLGVSAAFVIALHQAGRGDVADQAARLGMNAVELFNLRGMAYPGMWRSANGTTPNLTTNPTGSYCIDPLFVAMNGTTSNASYSAAIFPYVVAPNATPPEPRMTRVGLFSGAAPPTPQVMASLQAEELFLAQDELVFDTPKDVSLPPAQNFGSNSSKRQTQGRFSWMATLVPRVDLSGQARDLYILSIVVFHRRDSSYEMNELNERVVNVKDFPGSGFSGGEVILQSTDVGSLDLKSGNWVMLMGNLIQAPQYMPYFRWYRVAETASEPDLDTSTNPNTWQRDVTLQGADWPLTTPASVPTRAVLVDNVVGVYERTIRLESSSLWSW